jgi:hypothetical protein
MYIKYVEKKFGASAISVINQANKIISEYQRQGYDLTLRQLYYQFVARDLIPNKMKEYKRLGKIINDARLAGLISWSVIVDRTRDLRKNPHWSDPRGFLESVVPQYQIDKWQNQPYRVEVWIEKDALVGVIERICRKLDVSYFSCRGYTSQSEMHDAALRLKEHANEDGQEPVIIHLGDHDPSGIDMSRDIKDRLDLFMGGMEVKRIALNMNQVEQYNPPPNPCKTTDSRSSGYIQQFGHESWELDALDPKVLADLVQRNVLKFRDQDLWDEMVVKETSERKTLSNLANHLPDEE